MDLPLTKFIPLTIGLPKEKLLCCSRGFCVSGQTFLSHPLISCIFGRHRKSLLFIEPTQTGSLPVFRYPYYNWTILHSHPILEKSPVTFRIRFWKQMYLTSHLKARKPKPWGCQGLLGEVEKYHLYSWGYSQTSQKKFLKIHRGAKLCCPATYLLSIHLFKNYIIPNKTLFHINSSIPWKFVFFFKNMFHQPCVISETSKGGDILLKAYVFIFHVMLFTRYPRHMNRLKHFFFKILIQVKVYILINNIYLMP